METSILEFLRAKTKEKLGRDLKDDEANKLYTIASMHTKDLKECLIDEMEEFVILNCRCRKCKIRQIETKGVCHICKICEDNKIADVEEFNRFYNNCATGEKFDKKDIDSSGLSYLKQKFTDRDISRIGAECIRTGISIDLVARYVKYRIEIKKPIKTTRPLKSFIQKLIEAEEKGYSVEQVVDIMMENEWATFELDWIDRKIPKKSTQGSLSEFGFNQGTQGLLK